MIFLSAQNEQLARSSSQGKNIHKQSCLIALLRLYSMNIKDH